MNETLVYVENGWNTEWIFIPDDARANFSFCDGLHAQIDSPAMASESICACNPSQKPKCAHASSKSKMHQVFSSLFMLITSLYISVSVSHTIMRSTSHSFAVLSPFFYTRVIDYLSFLAVFCFVLASARSLFVLGVSVNAWHCVPKSICALFIICNYSMSHSIPLLIPAHIYSMWWTYAVQVILTWLQPMDSADGPPVLVLPLLQLPPGAKPHNILQQQESMFKVCKVAAICIVTCLWKTCTISFNLVSIRSLCTTWLTLLKLTWKTQTTASRCSSVCSNWRAFYRELNNYMPS